MSSSVSKTWIDGRTWITGRFPLPAEKWQAISRSLDLSDRELEVVQAVFAWSTDASIAEHLGRSSHTIHSQLDRVYKKLGVSNRCGLVVRIFTEYLLLESPLLPDASNEFMSGY